MQRRETYPMWHSRGKQRNTEQRCTWNKTALTPTAVYLPRDTTWADKSSREVALYVSDVSVCVWHEFIF